ncbi:MAG: zf-HC2 domain-containing protein [Thermodesulfobacteriota bacterium]
MTTCNDIREDLSAYLDGVLDSEKIGFIESHLHLCRDCRKEFESLKEVRKMVRSLPLVEPPADFLNQINTRIRSRPLISRIAEVFSIPVRINTLSRIAAASVAGILILLLVTIQKDERPKRVSAPVDNRLGEEIKPQAIPPAIQKRAVPSPIQTLKEDTVSAVTEEEPLELTLILFRRQRKPVVSAAPSGPEHETGSGSKPVTIYELKQDTGNSARKMKAPAETLNKRAGSVEKDDISTDSLSDPDIRLELLRRIQFLEGGILSEFTGNSGEELLTLLAELPEKNLELFYQSLKDLGIIDNPLQDRMPKNQGMIRIRIRIVSKEGMK